MPAERDPGRLSGAAAPGALPDLSTPAQIHDLVVEFYREIVFDELLEPVFGEAAEVDWAEHLPKLVDYWCWIVLGQRRYVGAVIAVHRQLNELTPIGPEHCDRWFSLWVRSVDGRWGGPHAEHAKSHAASLMAGMAKRLFGFTWTTPGDSAAGADLGRVASDL